MIIINVPVVIISCSGLGEAVALCQASLLDVNRVFLKFSSDLKVFNILSVPHMVSFLTFLACGVSYQVRDQSLNRNRCGDHILFGSLNVLSTRVVEMVWATLPLIMFTAAVFDFIIVPVTPVLLILRVARA